VGTQLEEAKDSMLHHPLDMPIPTVRVLIADDEALKDALSELVRSRPDLMVHRALVADTGGEGG
jgi:cytosine/adenosine deaminase-related metal-dependent hydrolase